MSPQKRIEKKNSDQQPFFQRKILFWNNFELTQKNIKIGVNLLSIVQTWAYLFKQSLRSAQSYAL